MDDAPDLLARDLAQPDLVEIGDWADRHRIAVRTLSRQFRMAFGVTASHHRWRSRTRAAWRALLTEGQPIVEVAATWGFSDQAHLTRSILALTGQSPGWWKRTAGRLIQD
jgi:AraC-like DNA-binding protein